MVLFFDFPKSMQPTYHILYFWLHTLMILPKNNRKLYF